MGRQPCCDKVGLKKGPWTAEEDKKLMNFILTNEQCCWRAVPKLAGLLRCGKSCRLRWTNYLRPDLKRGLLSDSEEKLVIDLHSQLGNRWSKIAAQLPGRTDNEIKNYWNTHLKKKLKKMGIDPLTHKPIISSGEIAQEQRTTSTSTSSSPIIETDDAFGTDEVPMIQPHEIIVPSVVATAALTSDSTSLTMTTESKKAEESSDQMPCMEMQEEMVHGWGMDDLFWLYCDDFDGKLLGFDPFSI